MSSHDPDLHDNDLSRLYRQGAQSEPGREVDERILSAAHRAVQSQRPAWWKLASTAAVLVLSFALVMETFIIDPVEQSSGSAPPQKEEAALPAPVVQTAPNPEAEAQSRLPAAEKLMRSPQARRQSLAPRSTADSSDPGETLPAAPASLPSMRFDSPAEMSTSLNAMRDQQLSSSDCSNYSMPDSSDEIDWLRLATQLQATGDMQQLACLKAAFVARFGRQFPESD